MYRPFQPEQVAAQRHYSSSTAGTDVMNGMVAFADDTVSDVLLLNVNRPSAIGCCPRRWAATGGARWIHRSLPYGQAGELNRTYANDDATTYCGRQASRPAA